jgi:hypothetical protein
MSRSVLPPGPEVPESTASELQALYREAAQAEPDAMLDRRILDAARAELRDAGATKARRQPPWWKGWLPAASALVIGLVGLSVTWRVMDQQERNLRQEMKAAEGVRERPAEVAGNTAPAPRTADAPPRDATPVVQKSGGAESTTLKDAPPAVPASAAPVPMAPTTPADTSEALKKSLRAGKEELRERDANAASGVAPGPARQAGKFEAGAPAVGSSGANGATAADSLAAPSVKAAAKSAAAPAIDGTSPEAWLQGIRELRATGRSAEAAESLARFRARYPDFVLPDDLLKLK